MIEELDVVSAELGGGEEPTPRHPSGPPAEEVGTVDKIANVAALLLGSTAPHHRSDLLIDGAVIAAIRAGCVQLSV